MRARRAAEGVWSSTGSSRSHCLPNLKPRAGDLDHALITDPARKRCAIADRDRLSFRSKRYLRSHSRSSFRLRKTILRPSLTRQRKPFQNRAFHRPASSGARSHRPARRSCRSLSSMPIYRPPTPKRHAILAPALARLFTPTPTRCPRSLRRRRCWPLSMPARACEARINTVMGELWCYSE